MYVYLISSKKGVRHWNTHPNAKAAEARMMTIARHQDSIGDPVVSGRVFKVGKALMTIEAEDDDEQIF